MIWIGLIVNSIWGAREPYFCRAAASKNIKLDEAELPGKVLGKSVNKTEDRPELPRHNSLFNLSPVCEFQAMVDPAAKHKGLDPAKGWRN